MQVNLKVMVLLDLQVYLLTGLVHVSKSCILVYIMNHVVVANCAAEKTVCIGITSGEHIINSITKGRLICSSKNNIMKYWSFGIFS